MGSWKRTITSPFRKARTAILSPQQQGQQSGGGGGDTPRARRHKGSSAAAVVEEESPAATAAQLYGDVMACAYEDVQVMWSMLDNKSRLALHAHAHAADDSSS
ncbi:uncharacterized protein LOC104582761 [Brachypodium distachyon]|uniref:Uncharacterized protein n=1 Tax=Brachypodium distachyon TaxID=15368 RepID=I1HM49_BRADI|nr:uncharacterized protein LOC104582761 [Brachypodium distachyon]KQK07653.1 hypothetical protein BRADI_2g36790v3 [Brachypodium distachyon]|eukprot:XP_010231745.1 uncharacterized protein LOC104582761 [Brachypodium distachyon]